MKTRSEELQVFVAVIDCGSISAAAEQMGQTPSAVSRTLSRLGGKLGATLVDRTLPIGEHRVNFDASSLPAGAYLYTLEAGPYTLSRKMVVTH